MLIIFLGKILLADLISLKHFSFSGLLKSNKWKYISPILRSTKSQRSKRDNLCLFILCFLFSFLLFGLECAWKGKAHTKNQLNTTAARSFSFPEHKLLLFFASLHHHPLTFPWHAHLSASSWFLDDFSQAEHCSGKEFKRQTRVGSTQGQCGTARCGTATRSKTLKF